MGERRRPMRLVNARFPDAVYDAVQSAAEGFGISAAQFIREATLMRLARLEVLDLLEASATPAENRAVVMRTFAEISAREADRLGCPELAERIRATYQS